MEHIKDILKPIVAELNRKGGAMGNAIQVNTAQEIRQLHNKIEGYILSSIDNALRIGELLSEQKKALKHGEFTVWVSDNLPFSVRTAQNYMRVYRNKSLMKNESVSHLAQAYNLLPEKVRKDECLLPESFTVAEWEDLLATFNNQVIRDKRYFISLDTSFWESKFGGDGSMTVDEIKRFSHFIHLMMHFCLGKHHLFYEGVEKTPKPIRSFLSEFHDLEELTKTPPRAICALGKPDGKCPQHCWGN